LKIGFNDKPLIWVRFAYLRPKHLLIPAFSSRGIALCGRPKDYSTGARVMCYPNITAFIFHTLCVSYTICAIGFSSEILGKMDLLCYIFPASALDYTLKQK